MKPFSLFVLLLAAAFQFTSCSKNEKSSYLPNADGDVDSSEVSDLDDGVEQDKEAVRAVTYTEDREPCAHYNPNRNLYFGDLHAHSRFSWDAFGYDMRTTLDEAYAFAKGQSVKLPPLGLSDNGTRSVSIDRPLDFVGMTDHIEYIGEYLLCTDSASDVYDTEDCLAFRTGGQQNVTKFGIRLASADPSRLQTICGSDNSRCQESAKKAWKLMVEAAEAAYDKSEQCDFTAFVAYEYTGSPSVVNFHRNVLFRNATVPELPPSYFDQPTPQDLWASLESGCTTNGEGCEVMVMPHNSNWSNGNMYTPDYPKGSDIAEQRRLSEWRARMEPVGEVMQHKGDMECKNGFDGLEFDPYCDFEKIREANFDDCGDKTGSGGANGFGCISRLDYIRNVFSYGLKEKRRIGFNPYKLGIFGSTDTHNGTPGMVGENGFPGHVGLVDDTAEKRLGSGTITHQPRTYNPGGLAAVWAHENSRDAIYEAFKRKEIYSTSGPRIAVRFFGGWDYPDWACSEDNIASLGYRDGGAMGSDLTDPPNAEAKPAFILQALMDAGTDANPGVKLKVSQIIKGWIDASGNTHEQVFDVSGSSLNGSSVNEATCETSGTGDETHCAVWVDEQFDSTQDAYYYARVIQNPTCRWVAYDCMNASPEARPAACDDPTIQKSHHERAWTTPIWYDAR